MDNEIKAIRVDNTPYGLGVFATENFYTGQIIGEVCGRIIDGGDYGSEYCIDLGNNQSLEPAAPMRYLNHCCDPNCRLVWIEAAETTFEIHGSQPAAPDIILEAIQEIAPDQQLTIDYCWSAESAIACQCNSLNCRGWIVDKDELHKLSVLTTPKSNFSADNADVDF